jgi:hypothetical protein
MQRDDVAMQAACSSSEMLNRNGNIYKPTEGSRQFSWKFADFQQQRKGTSTSWPVQTPKQ